MNYCVDCGTPTGSVRCRQCNGAYQRMRAAIDLAELDKQLLRWVDDEKLSPSRVAVRLGVSRTRAGVKIREARARQKLLSES